MLVFFLHHQYILAHTPDPNNTTAFTYYNGVNGALKLNQISIALILHSPEIVEDPSWCIDSRVFSHIISNSCKIFNSKPYFGS